MAKVQIVDAHQPLLQTPLNTQIPHSGFCSIIQAHNCSNHYFLIILLSFVPFHYLPWNSVKCLFHVNKTHKQLLFLFLISCTVLTINNVSTASFPGKIQIAFYLNRSAFAFASLTAFQQFLLPTQQVYSSA